MTKKQYFMCLWGLWALTSLKQGMPLMKSEPFGLWAFFIYIVIDICCYGFWLSLGMDFAKKIGLRFLFLEDNIDWYKDFLQPAVVASIAYSSVFWAIHVYIPFMSVVLIDPFSWNMIFDHEIKVVVDSIRASMIGILVIFSGFVLLIKKLTKNISLSIVVPAVIALMMIVPNIIEYTWQSSAGVPWLFTIEKLMSYVGMVLFCAVAWLKSFETAVFCSILTTIILSLIMPMIFYGFGLLVR